MIITFLIFVMLLALGVEFALRAVWDRLPEPSRYCQAMYGPKIKRMQTLADSPPVDVVIIGNSVSAIGLDPSIILKHLPEGTTCFNAAVGLANIHIQERFLPDYVLPLLRPRLVILGTDSGALGAWEPGYEEKNYDKAWATSETTYGKIRRTVTSRSRLLDAINGMFRDADYRSAIWRRARRRSGLSASERVDHYITALGHRVPLRPVSDEEQLASIDSKHDIYHYEPGPRATDSWLRLKDRFDSLPSTQFVTLMMASSPRDLARSLNGMADYHQGRADWAEFCEEHDIISIDIDDGSYTDDDFGDLHHPMWPAVRRQSKALGEELATRWERLMPKSRIS